MGKPASSLLAGLAALTSGMAPRAGATESAETRNLVRQCPPFAFVKRHHFRRPFGVGTLYCWNVFSPGCAICIYDPAHPDMTHLLTASLASLGAFQEDQAARIAHPLKRRPGSEPPGPPAIVLGI